MRGQNYAKTIARSLAAAAICLGPAVKRAEAVERDRRLKVDGITCRVHRGFQRDSNREDSFDHSTIIRCFAEPLLLANYWSPQSRSLHVPPEEWATNWM